MCEVSSTAVRKQQEAKKSRPHTTPQQAVTPHIRTRVESLDGGTVARPVQLLLRKRYHKKRIYPI